MADEIRSSQNLAQIEWQAPGFIKSFQTLAQVEWEEVGWTGKINGVTNPAKINGVVIANISKVMGVS